MMTTKRKTENPSRETIKMLPIGLKKFIRDSFEEAKKLNLDNYKNQLEGNYIPADNISLNTNLQQSLQNRRDYVPTLQEDKILELYVPSFRDLHEQRLAINLMKTILVEFTDDIRWINIWYTHRKGKPYFSAKTIADVKAMIAAWTKNLLKSAEQVFANNPVVSPPHIRDFFRCTCICCNTVEDLLEFTQVIVSILTNPDSNEYKEFFEWVEHDTHTYGGLRIPREKLLNLKNFKFSIGYIKNYISNPKGAYQSWQATITITEAPDTTLKGKDFEFKVLTWEMYKCAKIGDAAHDDYKKEIYELTRELFPLNDYEQEFFCENLDEDGLNEHEEFYSRRSSGHTIQKL